MTCAPVWPCCPRLPGRFALAIQRWSRLNANSASHVRIGRRIPDRNTEYFYYQTLIGAWPHSRRPLHSYMEKAMREAKQHTSWVANNKEFEDALNSFIDWTLAHEPFIAEARGSSSLGSPHAGRRQLARPDAHEVHRRPACPISTREASSGTSAWSIPTTAGPSTTSCAASSSRRLQQLSARRRAQIMQRADEGLPKMWIIHHALRACAASIRSGSELRAAYRPLNGRRLEGRPRHRYAARRIQSSPSFLDWSSGSTVPWRRTRLRTARRPLDESLDAANDLKVAVSQVENLLRDFPVALLTRDDVSSQCMSSPSGLQECKQGFREGRRRNLPVQHIP